MKPKLIKIFNPLGEDFKTTYDINGDRRPLSFTLHAQEIEAFEEPVALHIKEQLSYRIARDIQGKGGYEVALEKARRMVEVNE